MWKFLKGFIMGTPKNVVVIVGTTGVGKSQLSIELAKRFNGEIINADSMQMYKGAPIITNKHPMEEREGIPHHVMNHVNWDEEYFIHRFSKEADKAIDDIHGRGKLPIIVGGTHYYLNSLLFNNKTITVGKTDDVSTQLTPEQQGILDGSSERVFELLKKYDPQVAQKFHPNDSRRIRRALEIYYTTNKQASHHYNAQEEQLKSQSALKYNTLLFWIFAQKPQLDKRLDDRVDQMLSKGGTQEIQELYDCYKKHLQKPDLERGIWQVIGFKEFLPWLESGRQSDKLLKECVDSMKAHTRQYAKKQVKWIKGLLASDLKKEENHDYIHGGRLYLLDATALDDWQTNVSKRAVSITDEFLKGQNSISQTPAVLSGLLVQEEQEDKTAQWKHIVCPVCHNQDNSPLIIVGDKQYNIHLKSKRHRSNLNRGKRKRDYEEWLSKKDKATETST